MFTRAAVTILLLCSLVQPAASQRTVRTPQSHALELKQSGATATSAFTTIVNAGTGNINEAVKAVAAVYSLAATQLASTLRESGLNAIQVAAQMAELGHSVGAIAAALHAAGFDILQIAKALKANGASGGEVAKQLATLRYPFDAIAQALVAEFGAQAVPVATWLRGAGADATQCALALRAAGFSDQVIAQALLAAGHAITTLASAMTALGLSIEATAASLKMLGVQTAIIADIVALTNLSIQDQVNLLKSIQATSVEVAAFLQLKYKKTQAEILVILKSAGYSAQAAAQALMTTFALSAEQAVTLVIAYGVQEMANAAKALLLTHMQFAKIMKAVAQNEAKATAALASTYGASAAQSCAALRSAGYAVANIALALRDTYQLNALGLARALYDGGYNLDAVTAGLTAAFTLTAQQLAAVLADVFGPGG